MPKFLEKKLQEKYGKDSSVPYKIMNKLGFMRGSKETPKGKAAEVKHEKGIHGEKEKDKEVKEVKAEIGCSLDDKNRGEMVAKYMKGKK